MSTLYTLTETRVIEGIWEALVSPADPDVPQPDFQVTYLEKPLDKVVFSDVPDGGWRMRVTIPMQFISDGAHTFLVTDRRSDEKISSFTILCGDAVNDDIRAEIDLLRAELDMLKRAFRRHCVETL